MLIHRKVNECNKVANSKLCSRKSQRWLSLEKYYPVSNLKLSTALLPFNSMVESTTHRLMHSSDFLPCSGAVWLF